MRLHLEPKVCRSVTAVRRARATLDKTGDQARSRHADQQAITGDRRLAHRIEHVLQLRVCVCACVCTCVRVYVCTCVRVCDGGAMNPACQVALSVLILQAA